MLVPKVEPSVLWMEPGPRLVLTLTPECVLVLVPVLDCVLALDLELWPVFLPKLEVGLYLGLCTRLGMGKGWLDSQHLFSPSLLSF